MSIYAPTNANRERAEFRSRMRELMRKRKDPDYVYDVYTDKLGFDDELVKGEIERMLNLPDQNTVERDGRQFQVNTLADQESYETLQEKDKLQKTIQDSAVADLEKKLGTLNTLLENPRGIDEAVGPNKIARMTGGSYFTGNKQRFVAEMQRLLSSETLQALIDAKAEGATFGALSEKELNMLAESASTIGGFAIRDKDGKVIGYNATEKDMLAELNKWKAGAELALNNMQGTTEEKVDPQDQPQQDYSGKLDFSSRDEAIMYARLNPDDPRVSKIKQQLSGDSEALGLLDKEVTDDERQQFMGSTIRSMLGYGLSSNEITSTLNAGSARYDMPVNFTIEDVERYISDVSPKKKKDSRPASLKVGEFLGDVLAGKQIGRAIGDKYATTMAKYGDVGEKFEGNIKQIEKLHLDGKIDKDHRDRLLDGLQKTMEDTYAYDGPNAKQIAADVGKAALTVGGLYVGGGMTSNAIKAASGVGGKALAGGSAGFSSGMGWGATAGALEEIANNPEATIHSTTGNALKYGMYGGIFGGVLGAGSGAMSGIANQGGLSKSLGLKTRTDTITDDIARSADDVDDIGKVAQKTKKKASSMMGKATEREKTNFLNEAMKKEAFKQGWDERQVDLVEHLNKKDKKVASIMMSNLDEAEGTLLKNSRPTDVVGENFVDKIRALKKVEMGKGKKIGDIANKLGNKTRVDITAAADSVDQLADDLGIVLKADGTLDFADSVFQDNTAIQKKITKIVADAHKGEMGFKQAHLRKQALDELIYGTKKMDGLQGKSKAMAKNLRNKLSQALAEQSDDYARANLEFANLRDVTNRSKKVFAPSEIDDLFGDNKAVSKKVGQKLRGIQSNNLNRGEIEQLANEVDVAGELFRKEGYSIPNSGSTYRQLAFANMIDDAQLYKETAPTSFRGQVTQGEEAVKVARNIAKGKSGIIDEGFNILGAGVNQIRGIGAEQKRQILRDMITEGAEKYYPTKGVSAGLSLRNVADDKVDAVAKNLTLDEIDNMGWWIDEVSDPANVNRGVNQLHEDMSKSLNSELVDRPAFIDDYLKKLGVTGRRIKTMNQKEMVSIFRRVLERRREMRRAGQIIKNIPGRS